MEPSAACWFGGFYCVAKEANVDFVVKRSEWYRGQGSQNSELLRFDGKRCCIGFVGQQCRIDDADLRGQATVEEVYPSESYRLFPVWMKVPHSPSLNLAYRINDDVDIDDDEREKQLKALFALQGDTISFVD